jgi:hypothetical protein
MALPVFFGMFVEMVSLFVVPVLYCGYMEMKLNLISPGSMTDSVNGVGPVTLQGAVSNAK